MVMDTPLEADMPATPASTHACRQTRVAEGAEPHSMGQPLQNVYPPPSSSSNFFCTVAHATRATPSRSRGVCVCARGACARQGRTYTAGTKGHCARVHTLRRRVLLGRCVPPLPHVGASVPPLHKHARAHAPMHARTHAHNVQPTNTHAHTFAMPPLSIRAAAALEEVAAAALLRCTTRVASLYPRANADALPSDAATGRRVCDLIGEGARVSVSPTSGALRVACRVPSPAAHYVPNLRALVRTNVLRAVTESGVLPAGEAPHVEVECGASEHHHAAMRAAGAGLEGVGSVIAVSSGKGGVGKSTVAVNLAYALAARGARVGIFDADIHGPSLPTMVSPTDTAVVKQANGHINPLHFHDVALMSYGWVAPRNARGERAGAVMRGPMVSSVVQQLLKFTEWGQLDHLVLDMPPGTSDIHITLGQMLPIAAAVIVSTPQRLAQADVVKGLDMFASLRIPTAALALNMAYFEPGDDASAPHKRYYP
ncbi:hypothetical protein EON68_01360, partial [archaeon]